MTDEQIEKVIEKAISAYDKTASLRIDEAVARTSEETRRHFEVVGARLERKLDRFIEVIRATAPNSPTNPTHR